MTRDSGSWVSCSILGFSKAEAAALLGDLAFLNLRTLPLMLSFLELLEIKSVILIAQSYSSYKVVSTSTVNLGTSDPFFILESIWDISQFGGS